MRGSSFVGRPRAVNFQIAPLPEESGWGYLHRLAEANGYADSRQVVEYFEVLFGRTLPHLIEASHWFALAPRCLGEISTWLDGQHGIIMVDEMGQATKDFCAACLREGSPFLMKWSEPGRFCRAHLKALDSTCWSCGLEQSWLTGRLDACRCGTPIVPPPFCFGRNSPLCAEELATSERVESKARRIERAGRSLEEQHRKLEEHIEANPDGDDWDAGPVDILFETLMPGALRKGKKSPGGWKVVKE